MENRIIKFRGKMVNGTGWVYGYYVKDPKCKHRIYWQPFSDATSNTYHFVTSNSVGQFTGLHDKNGKEIYEGDRVNVDCSGVGDAFNDGICQVEYLLPDCAFALIRLDGKFAISFNECYEYEVIGNKFESK